MGRHLCHTGKHGFSSRINLTPKVKRQWGWVLLEILKSGGWPKMINEGHGFFGVVLRVLTNVFPYLFQVHQIQDFNVYKLS